MLTETDMSSQPCHPLSLLVITRREVYNISHGERLPASSCQLLRGAADDRMPGLTAQNDRKPYVPKTGVQTPTTAMHSGTKLQHAFRKIQGKTNAHVTAANSIQFSLDPYGSPCVYLLIRP